MFNLPLFLGLQSNNSFFVLPNYFENIFYFFSPPPLITLNYNNFKEKKNSKVLTCGTNWAKRVVKILLFLLPTNFFECFFTKKKEIAKNDDFFCFYTSLYMFYLYSRNNFRYNLFIFFIKINFDGIALFY